MWGRRKNKNNLDKKAFLATFPEVPRDIGESIYELVYTTGLGFMRLYTDPDKFQKVLLLFSEFATQAAVASGEVEDDREAKLADYPSARVANWVTFDD